MLRRNLIDLVLAALQDTPAVFLNGARQTGKTTLAQALTAEGYPAAEYTFDDVSVLSAAKEDPAGFVQGLPTPVVLDEVQRVPEIFLALKAAIDRDRIPGRFLLTGSANVLLLPYLADALVGRMEVCTLWPLSQGEIEGRQETFLPGVFQDAFPGPFTGASQPPTLWERILRGGYPEAIARADVDRRTAWFRAYVTTILQRDVRDLASIEGGAQLLRLLALCATRLGGLLNFADLSRTVDLPQSTLKRYMALLEATFLVQPLPAWSSNPGKRLVKSPKLYLNDPGLAAYLSGVTAERLQSDRALIGPLLENFVVMELQKQASWMNSPPTLWHFRTLAGLEVDLVLENRAGELVGIEVKAAATVTGADFKGLHGLAELTRQRFRRGVVLYTGNQVIPFGARLHALPVDALWRMAAMRT